MSSLFPQHISAAAAIGSESGDIEAILSLISNRYIGNNPPLPYVYRTYSGSGFRQLADGRYDISLTQRLPHAGIGQYAYAFGLVWNDSPKTMELSVSCYGPTKLWLNGVPVYKSSIIEEVNHTVIKNVAAELKTGWNSLFLSFRRAPSGFGCLIGSARSKWAPLDVLSPFREREGQAGWIYSEAAPDDLYGERGIPDPEASELDSPASWHPRTSRWRETGEYVLAWSALRQPFPGTQAVRISGQGKELLALFVDGKCSWEGASDQLELELPLPCGVHTIVAVAAGLDEMKAVCGTAALEWSCPRQIRGYDGAWLFLGGFRRPPMQLAREQPELERVYADGPDRRYWRAGETDNWVRPYIESPVYGRWNYPAGVTLYGLLQTGRLIGRPDVADYARSHIRTCVDAYAYAAWSLERHGYASVNQQLMELNMLDDCGSIGSAMLESGLAAENEGCLHAADIIADYIMNRQERKEDGAFYREQKGYFMENTMWADDLYMCVPFLIRYAKFRRRPDCLEEAVRQFLLYRGYLYMPDSRLMSHVYDFKYLTPTYVPWGRGNGWTLFSLAELLTELAADHPAYASILSFYRELSQGVLEVQGKRGLWHQVLTDPDSYEETSCTAMFVYALARGVRLGLYPQPAAYGQAAERGWQALAGRAVDRQGNVHGVCQGSRYSFSADYYKHELPWRTNDTHGIGIVLLAGVEIAMLRNDKESR